MAVGRLRDEADLARFVEELLEKRLRELESRIAAIEARLTKAGI
jgi:hypothetical protein